MSLRPRMPLLVRILSTAIALAAAVPGMAHGQSLLSSRGLGLVTQPLDARMRGLGGVALGLPGNEPSFSSPASAVGLSAPVALVGYQFDSFSATYGSRLSEGTTARFPLILAATPIGERWALLAGYSSFIDQNWAVERSDTIVIGIDTLVDRRASTGGVARLRLAAGYGIVPGLAVGLGADIYTGSTILSVGRHLPAEESPRCCTTEFTFSGLGYTAGVSWRPSEALSLAGAASIGGALEAEADDTLAVDRSYDLPVMVTFGASGRVASNVLLAASGDWAGWGTLDDELLRTGGARDSWSLQGGVEWDGITVRDRPIPVRLGGRAAALPFRWDVASADAEWIDERALTGGLGVVLAGTAARADLAVERGWRGADAAGIQEDFWRFALSLSVLGR